VFARAERSDVASGAALPAVENGSPDEPEVGAARRSVRSPQLIALVLALACTAACQSTTVSGLNVRAGPSTSSKIVARMSGAGTAVYIDCYTRGQSIYGQTIWYRITQPHKGYVTAYYVRTDSGAVGPKRAC
jgi:uncharacterized protein YraI